MLDSGNVDRKQKYIKIKNNYISFGLMSYEAELPFGLWGH